ncbi:hypothetical protein B8W49_18565 [Cronobacter sakazakii]|nr:hypothetical protein C5965_04040 [Cronobacter sakazakii]PRC63618.1 hypothetical protein B8W49_18565 [Cronobacter sakazakii]PUW75239.1 hypothetical protein CBR17_00950 [Cronobacter sakazakii]PUW81618.1 hypothetical protein CCQ25_16725 [Cronobacter sakazakii]
MLMSVQNTPTAAGATQVNALVGIKSRPGWLIVVAGHTDDVGDERANQQLSLQPRLGTILDEEQHSELTGITTGWVSLVNNQVYSLREKEFI